MADLESSILANFFSEVDEIVASLVRLKKIGNTVLEDMKENLGLDNLGDRLAEINQDLDHVKEKMQVLDYEILRNNITKTHDEKVRQKEYEEQIDLINTFMPAMIAYSIKK